VRRALLLAALAALPGCRVDRRFSNGTLICATSDECPKGSSCQGGFCCAGGGVCPPDGRGPDGSGASGGTDGASVIPDAASGERPASASAWDSPQSKWDQAIWN
jgi:hypothetical protein